MKPFRPACLRSYRQTTDHSSIARATFRSSVSLRYPDRPRTPSDAPEALRAGVRATPRHPPHSAARRSSAARPAESQLPLRNLLVGDFGEEHVRRIDALPRVELVEEFCRRLIRPWDDFRS